MTAKEIAALAWSLITVFFYVTFKTVTALIPLMLLIVVLLFPTASTSLACGGPCPVTPTPTPKPHYPPKKTPTPTKVPPSTPTAAPTSQPLSTPGVATPTAVATGSTSPVATVAPAAPTSSTASAAEALSASASGPNLPLICLWQPTTQMYEQRAVPDALKAINGNLDTAHPAYVMPPEGVCSQPVAPPLPTSAPTTPAANGAEAVSLVTLSPAAPGPTPASTTEPNPAPPTTGTLTPSQPETPPTEDETPVPEIPQEDVPMPPVQLP